MPLETFFTVSEQTGLFLRSIVIGAALGVIYEIFRVLRVLIPHKSFVVFLEDILFCTIWGLIMLMFVIEAGRGELRLYYILGNALGFVLYLVTLGKVVNGVIRGIAGAIKAVFCLIFRTLVRPLGSGFVALYLMVKPFFVNVYLKLRKFSRKREKGLKKRKKLLYNKHIRKKESVDLSKKDVNGLGKRKS